MGLVLPEPSERIDERMLKVWRLLAWIGGGFLPLCAAGAGFATWKWGWPWWIAAVLLILGIVEIWISGYWIPAITWRNWRYEIRDEEIDLRRGVLTVKRTVIPMVRIQHVDMKQGPIMRKYGLASITFSTAAGGHEIPGLSLETADLVRARISELARLNHEDL